VLLIRARTLRLASPVGAIAGIIGVTLAIHWLAFRLFGLQLPRERVALFFVPLLTLLPAAIAALPAPEGPARWVRRGLLATLLVLAGHHLLCLRLTYFREWDFDAEVKDVYPILARYNHDYCVQDVGVKWFYTSSLNFYRVLSHHETFPAFVQQFDPEPGKQKQLYVLHAEVDDAFIKSQKLRIVFSGPVGWEVVAEPPDFAERVAKSGCVAGR
jgi:hypothetical protein